MAVGSALKVTKPGTEFEAKKTVKAGQKLNKAKTDMAKAVEKWAFDDGLDGQAQEGTVGPHGQRDRVHPDLVRRLPLGLPDHDVGAAVRGVLLVLRAVVGATASVPGGPRQAANYGRAQADSTAC